MNMQTISQKRIRKMLVVVFCFAKHYENFKSLLLLLLLCVFFSHLEMGLAYSPKNYVNMCFMSVGNQFCVVVGPFIKIFQECAKHWSASKQLLLFFDLFCFAFFFSCKKKNPRRRNATIKKNVVHARQYRGYVCAMLDVI